MTRYLTRIALASSIALAAVGCEKDDADALAVDDDATDLEARGPRGTLMNVNPGFEGGLRGWQVYEAPSIAGPAIIQVLDNGQSRFHDKQLFMRLPKAATNNQSQYINIGQYLELSSRKRYRYSAHVKWVNKGQTRLPSAIVSAWAQNPDGTYNGKDFFITEGDEYSYISFEFTPNQTGKAFCYMSLLTHQQGFANTDIYVDAFRIEEIGDATSDADPRPAGENLLANSSFGDGFAGWTPTYWNPRKVAGLDRYLVGGGGDERMRLTLPGARGNTLLNNTWTGVYQKVTLYAGNTYEISAMVDRVVPDARQYPTIVNVYAYKPATQAGPEAWVGSVDYKFNRADRHRYSQTITPTETTAYQITTRVFGWGNDGRPVKVDLDDIQVTRVK